MMRPVLHTTLYLIITSVIFVVALTALSMGVWSVLTARADADAARAKAAQNEQQSIDMQAKATLAARTKLARANLTMLTIPPGGAAAYLSKIEDLANDERVTMSVTSITATAPKANTPGALVLALQLSGKYEDCMQFLQLVETQGVARTVSSVSLAYDEASKRWRGSILLSALSLDKP